MTAEGAERSRLRRAAVLWAAAVAVALALLAFLVGHGVGGRTPAVDAAAAQQRSVLDEQVEHLQGENGRLNARVAELEMARRLDREAYGEVEHTLGDLQSQLARQTDDLAFYRSIVSPADGVEGLRIQRLHIEQGQSSRSYRLRLTLIQAMRHESIVAGLAQVTIAGVQGGVPRAYSIGELLGKPRAQLPFSFRYFQTLEQEIQLPAGFEPFEVRVRLQSSKQRGRPVEGAYPWKVAG
ncbi:MAG: DUF6776 family protein [Steroidobacteraceae bacterium]